MITPWPKSARQITLPRDELKKLKLAVYARDGWKCRTPTCGARSNLHAHHVKFRSHGGDDAGYNLITLCERCHTAVHAYNLVIIAHIDVVKDKIVCNRFDWKKENGWSPQGRNQV